jgi:uncharacterized membrane protein YeaQ/YmgE (transglycosylase-associated protein family)
MLSLLVWLVFGLIVGVIAKLLMPGKDPGGFIVTILVGIVGSFVGGGLSWLIFGANDPYNPSGWIMSIVGALVLLYVYRLVKK